MFYALLKMAIILMYTISIYRHRLSVAILPILRSRQSETKLFLTSPDTSGGLKGSWPQYVEILHEISQSQGESAVNKFCL